MKKELKEKIIEIYIRAIELARQNNQVVGDKNDHYITIEQLEELLSTISCSNKQN